MFDELKQKYRDWRLARLHRKIAIANGSSWVFEYDEYESEFKHATSLKPLYFTDATSLIDFVHEVGKQYSEGPVQVTVTLQTGSILPVDEGLEEFINSSPGSRTLLRVDFNSNGKTTTIEFAAKDKSRKPRTTINGRWNSALTKSVMTACDEHAKPMRFRDRHRTIPLVEPIDAREESDRRNRLELNWRNILVSAMTGLLGGLIPLLVKAVLHL